MIYYSHVPRQCTSWNKPRLVFNPKSLSIRSYRFTAYVFSFSIEDARVFINQEELRLPQ